MRINIKAEGKIERILEAAQGKAWARVIEPKDLFRIAKAADAALDGATCSERRGMQAHYCEHAYGPNAYASKRFGGPSTYVVLERGARDWFLIKVERVYAPTITKSRNVDLTVRATETAIKAALEKIRHDRQLETLSDQVP